MVVDPRFNRSAALADHYAPIRAGSDIAFLSGVVNYLLTNDKIHHEYVRNYTNAAFIVRDDFGFEEGLFTGYDEEKRSYDRSSWEYVIGPDGFAERDMTLQHPRCVFQLMKQHFALYTPEIVERVRRGRDSRAPRCRPRRSATGRSADSPSGCSRRGPGQELRQPHQVVGGEAEDEGAVDPGQAAQLDVGEPGDLLHPAEALLDPLAHAQRDCVAGVAGGAPVDA
jgi:hypothetical protein